MESYNYFLILIILIFIGLIIALILIQDNDEKIVSSRWFAVGQDGGSNNKNIYTSTDGSCWNDITEWSFWR